jgi:hypothetical protein
MRAEFSAENADHLGVLRAEWSKVYRGIGLVGRWYDNSGSERPRIIRPTPLIHVTSS